MHSRQPIPAATKRLIRQRCGFGCVMCGCPIFDYEHIDGYLSTGHDPQRMTLLCASHHREKTAGRLSIERVRKWNDSPFNSGKTFTPGHPLYFEAEAGIELRVGNNRFLPGRTGVSMVGIAIDGDYAFGVSIGRDGHPVMTMNIHNRANEPRLRVDEGEMTLSTASWDIDFVGTRLTLRSAFRQKIVDVVLDGPSGLVDIQSASFSLNRVSLRVGKQALNGGFDFPALGVSGVSGVTFEGGGVAIGDERPANGTTMIHAVNVPRDA